MGNEVESFEHLSKIREACLRSAEDLVNSAKALLESGALQVSYHLAVLGLEEMGKFGLMETKFHMGRLSSPREFAPDIEDHVKKLFWAFFSMHLTGHKVDKKEFESLRGVASQIHKNRLDFLYVDAANPVQPRLKLTAEQVAPVIGLAENRIGYEKAVGFKEPTGELDENAKWFVLSSEDPDKRRFIFSEESYSKLAELQSFKEWIAWNKERYEESTKELRKLLEEEITREPTEDMTPKWKVHATFFSDSHSIRNSFISEWNKTSKFILVGKTNKPNELSCQFLLPKRITVGDIYDRGFAAAKIMAVALSAGTMGYFWWYVPSQGYFYTDRITDLENDAKLNFQPPNGLKIEWERQALKGEHVFMIKLMMAYLARIRDTPEEIALDAYLTGLSLIAKCDCHLEFVTNGFESFFRSLKMAMTVNREINDGESLYDAAVRCLGETITDKGQLKKNLEIGQQIENTKQGVPELRLNDVADMKSICDAYFLMRAAVVVRDSVYKKE
ncbi:MAG TPA: AbiV family abortive infection protein [Pyrinomonadaceae bacterium]|nr:AbiV family abortive infection protein [Pyrinomonadaceae bacterium]